MPEPRPHYRAERILDAATPITAHEGNYQALGRCRQCQKQITVVSDEEPGKLARGVLLGLFTAGRGGLTCEECLGETA